ncbi:hypothetical protein AUC70_11130 [Methyloceanibacter stevinii]|uniref:BON domain-containing protein n=1 Tax=Methyloceanibacter stevinii TaxID=1774970 RepID=A0A1E3VKN5_9HYPH|nr:hypothetical protein AUC70_11130 [Methyloceanibacter stevinii]
MLGALLGLLVVSSADTFAAADADSRDEAAHKATPKADGKAANKNAADTSAEESWFANLNQSKITLRGSAPSEEDRQTSLGMVKAHFPNLTIEDKVAVAQTDQPREQWLAAVSFGLQQLSLMSRGKVQVDGGALTVSGEAADAQQYGKLKKALSGTLPAGLTVKANAVRPPIADPFVFQADLGPNALSLAGSVPSEGARKDVRDLSRQLFERPGLDDRLEVASGAPKNWDKAVAAALRALSRLETGKVALTGVAVSIEGIAPDHGTAVAVSSQLRRDLPDRFSTSESIKWKEAASHLNLGLDPRTAQDVAATIIPRIKVPSRGQPLAERLAATADTAQRGTLTGGLKRP